MLPSCPWLRVWLFRTWTSACCEKLGDVIVDDIGARDRGYARCASGGESARCIGAGLLSARIYGGNCCFCADWLCFRFSTPLVTAGTRSSVCSLMWMLLRDLLLFAGGALPSVFSPM